MESYSSATPGCTLPRSAAQRLLSTGRGPGAAAAATGIVLHLQTPFPTRPVTLPCVSPDSSTTAAARCTVHLGWPFALTPQGQQYWLILHGECASGRAAHLCADVIDPQVVHIQVPVVARVEPQALPRWLHVGRRGHAGAVYDCCMQPSCIRPPAGPLLRAWQCDCLWKSCFQVQTWHLSHHIAPQQPQCGSCFVQAGGC